jgi:hypothetical protein
MLVYLFGASKVLVTAKGGLIDRGGVWRALR